MEYKNNTKSKDSFLFIDIISKNSLDALNKFLEKFNIHYTKKQVKKNIRVQQASKKFRFWDKLVSIPMNKFRGFRQK